MMLNEIEQPHFKMIEDCVDETYLSVIWCVQALLSQLMRCVIWLLIYIFHWSILRRLFLMVLLGLLRYLLGVFLFVFWITLFILIHLLESLWSLSDHHLLLVVAAHAFGLVGQRYVFIASLLILRWCLHELVLCIQNIDIFQMLTWLLKEVLLTVTLHLPSKNVGRWVLWYLTLSFVPVLEMRLLINHWFFVFMWRIDVHHLNLAFGVIDCACLILIANKLLGAWWAFAPLLDSIDVACTHDLLLVCLNYLGWICCVWACSWSTQASLIDVVKLLLILYLPHVVLRIQIVVSFKSDDILGVLEDLWAVMVSLQHHCTAWSLFEAHSMLLRVVIAWFACWMMHRLVIPWFWTQSLWMTLFIGISMAIIVLNSVVSAHWMLLLLLEMAHVEVLLLSRVAALILLIASICSLILLVISVLFSFEVVVGQVTDHVLVLLLLVLVRAASSIAQIRSHNDVVCIVDEIRILAWICSVLRGRSSVGLILISLNALRESCLGRRVLHRASRGDFIVLVSLILISLILLHLHVLTLRVSLTCIWIWYVLGEESNVVLPAIFMLDLGHLISAHLTGRLAPWVGSVIWWGSERALDALWISRHVHVLIVVPVVVRWVIRPWIMPLVAHTMVLLATHGWLDALVLWIWHLIHILLTIEIYYKLFKNSSFNNSNKLKPYNY